MNREHLNRLLSEYATGGLNESEKRELFAAALEDQALFDQLMEEDSLRELVEMPGARDYLIGSLEEEEDAKPVAMLARMSSSAPAEDVPVAPVSLNPSSKRFADQKWLAWAAGIGVIFVSGAFAYLLLEPGETYEMAKSAPPQATNRPESKPFPLPPSAAQSPAKPIKTIKVEEPPALPVAKESIRFSAPATIPLPAAGPPPMPKPIVAEMAKPVEFPASQQFRDQSQGALSPAPPGQQAMDRSRNAVSDEASRARADSEVRRTVPSAPRAAMSPPGNLAKTAEAMAPPSIWQRSGDGIWTRVAQSEAVAANATLVLRAFATGSQPMSLTDASGRILATRTGKAGEEIEFPIPTTALAGSSGREVQFYLRPSQFISPLGGVIGGVPSAARQAAGRTAQTPGISILLKVK